MSITLTRLGPTEAYSIVAFAAATVPTGVYEIVLRASAPDKRDQSVTLRLVVLPPEPISGNTRVRFCGVTPIFFAYQDGQGPWIARARQARDFAFDITSGRGAFVFTYMGIYSNGQLAYHTYGYYGTQPELNVFSAVCPSSSPNNGFVRGSFANGDDPKVSLGNASTRQPTFTLPLPQAP